MNKRVLLFIAIVTVATWFKITNFWFHNVDLSYIHQYIDITDTLKNLDILKVVRGHVIVHLPIYLLFGHKPFYYYLTSLILHSFLVLLLAHTIYHHTKNRNASVLGSLFFGINSSYLNVLFEGAFNMYYPLLGILIISSHLATLKNNKKALLTLLTIGFLIRETVLIVPILSAATIIVFKPKKIWKQEFINLLLPQLALSAAYLYFRFAFLGELKSDLTDDAVQFRNSMIKSGRIKDLLVFVYLNFARLTSQQIIPQAIVSVIKTQFSLIQTFILGTFLFGLTSILSTVIYVKNKNRQWVRLMVFGFIWMTVFNLFIAVVLPFPKHVLEATYTLDSVITRYNYYGAIGLSLLLASLGYRSKKVSMLLLLFVIVNFIVIQRSSNSLYKDKHLPAKNFYTTFFESYPTLPRKTVIYYNFFQINDLKDYVGDLVWIFSKNKYPNTEFILETTASHVQENIKNNNYSKNEVLALDLDENKNLIDKTKYLTENLESKVHELDKSMMITEDFLANKKTIVELQGSVTSQGERCNTAIESYMNESILYSKTAKVTTTSNYGDYPRFYFINPNFLSDNQTNRDFYWQADVTDTSPVVVIDLGHERNINLLAWEGESNSHSLPRDYEISTSNDNKNWESIVKIFGNTKASKVDFFENKPTRFIKMEISSTSLGQPPKLFEIKALSLPQLHQKMSSISDMEKSAIESGCTWKDDNGKSNIMVKLVSTTDLGSRKSYNQILKVDTVGNYEIPIVHLETTSNSRTILTEKLKNISIESSPNTKMLWQKIKISQ